MPGWGGFAEIVAGWILGEDGLTEFKHRLEGDRLAAAATAAHKEWRRNPTPENRKARDEARAALDRWSNTV